jgi:cell division protein FtsL
MQLATLENTFYIMSIVYMSVMFILIIALVTAVFVIRAKVIAIEENIQRKIDDITNLAGKSGELIAKVGSKAARAVGNKVKRATR